MSQVTSPLKSCKVCGYVPGASTGYPPLTAEERALLEQYGLELDKNVFGDDIARRKGHPYRGFYTARFYLHLVGVGTGRCK